MKTKEELIRAMSIQLRRIIDKHLYLEESPIRFDDSVQVTPREIHMIQAIGERETINITDLGGLFGVTKSAVSQIVSKLVNKGLVDKRQSLHSNKEVVLTLTPAGQRAFATHEEYHSRHMADIIKRLSVFSTSQITATSDLLAIIEQTINDRMQRK